MMRQKDKEVLIEQCKRFRDFGIEGRIRVVPAILDKRCFAPCSAGRCNCIPILWDEFTLVEESQYESSMKEYLEGMVRAQEEVDGILKELDNPVTKVTLAARAGNN